MQRQRPRLKNGVDLQLQSAFSDGNWPVVVRLAEKRARGSNGQYFEIVKTCALSQTDDPSAKFAAVEAISKFVKGATPVKDVDAIDLLEWASGDLLHEDDFSQTIGPLRVSAAKALSKDMAAVTRCLESCLLHWDLVSAQQIAAILERSFQQERGFMFWSIAITHLLAMSSQVPLEKRKLYGTLAQKQIERAAQTTEQTAAVSNGVLVSTAPRSIRTEEEILLLYNVVETHGSQEELKKLAESPIFGPVAQFRMGRKDLFLRMVAKYHDNGSWEDAYNICRECLSIEDGNGSPSFLASDWTIWKHFIRAAKMRAKTNATTVQEVQDILLRLIKAPNVKPLYRRNLLLARLSASFELIEAEEDMATIQPASTRIADLIHYLEEQAMAPTCFDDIKRFVERLDRPALRYVAYEYVPRLANASEEPRARTLRLLSLKLQYLVSTCASLYEAVSGKTVSWKCAICQSQSSQQSCITCLRKISQNSLELYSATKGSDSIDILTDLAILVAYCNIRIAHNQSSTSRHESLRRLLQATLILEAHSNVNPEHSVLSLLLSQAHLYLGSVHRAREVWDVLGVKRTIVDSLANLFYDRLSTIAPATVAKPNSWGERMMEGLTSHYHASLKLRMPRRLIDAFEAESYSSVIAIPKYIEKLRTSGTRTMSLVEEARAARMVGSRLESVLADPRYTEVRDETTLSEVIEYGSFPSWDCSECMPVYEHLRIGPLPSNRRSHLSILSEAFHEVLAWRPPAVYKALSASTFDQTFVIEMMNQLSNSFAIFHSGDGGLTNAEESYFEVISLLSTLITSFTGMVRASSAPSDLDLLFRAVDASLNTLKQGLPRGNGDVKTTVDMMASMHSLTMYREAAMATRSASQWSLDYADREKERDRSGQSNLPKQTVAALKDLHNTATEALKDGKEWISQLKESAIRRDFDIGLSKWVLEDAEQMKELVGSGLVTELVQDWWRNIKEWQTVKWE